MQITYSNRKKTLSSRQGFLFGVLYGYMNTLTQILTPLFIYLGLVAPAPVIPEFTPRPVEVVAPVAELVEPIEEPVVIIKEVIKEVVVEKPVYVPKVVPKPIVVPEVIVPEVVPEVVELDEVVETITNEKQERFDKKFEYMRKQTLKEIQRSKNTQFSANDNSKIYTYNRDLIKTGKSWGVEYEHLILEESE